MKQGRLDAYYSKHQRGEQGPGAAAAAPDAAEPLGAHGRREQGARQQQQQQQQQLQEEQLMRKRKADPDPDGSSKENREPGGDGGKGAADKHKLPANQQLQQQQQQQKRTPASTALQPGRPVLGSGGGAQSAGKAATATAPLSRLSGGKRSVQMFLDLGQRDFNASRCPSCGMVYARGQEEDEKLHRSYCAAGSQGVKFQGWACERVLLSYAFQGRLLMVLPSDPASHVKKVQEVAALVERLHSLTPGWLLAGEQWKAFLYVSTQRRVVGLLVAEPLRQAFRVVPQATGQEADSRVAVQQPPAQPPLQQQQPKAAIWRGLHGRVPTHAQQGLSGGGASSLGSGGTGAAAGAGARGADSCPPALLRPARGTGLSSPRGGSVAVAEATAVTPGSAVDEQLMELNAAGPSSSKGLGGHQAAPAPSTVAAAAPAPATGGRVLEIDRSRPGRAALGVRMVWVSAEHRRRGLASRLLDAARANVVQCYVAPRAQVAFTQPTEAGAALAAAYVGAQQGWLIYGV